MSNTDGKKQESTVWYVLRITLILLAITAIVAAALAAANKITAPIIQENNERKTQEAIRTVLESGYDVEITDFDDQNGVVTRVYKGADGYAVQVEPTGFSGAITMMIGIDNQGCILGISVIEQSETAGLGAVCAADNAKGEAFRAQFVGKSGVLSVIKSGEAGQTEVNAITGATRTSKAVTEGVNAALACVAGLG